MQSIKRKRLANVWLSFVFFSSGITLLSALLFSFFYQKEKELSSLLEMCSHLEARSLQMERGAIEEQTTQNGFAFFGPLPELLSQELLLKKNLLAEPFWKGHPLLDKREDGLNALYKTKKGFVTKEPLRLSWEEAPRLLAFLEWKRPLITDKGLSVKSSVIKELHLFKDASNAYGMDICVEQTIDPEGL